MSPGAQPPRGPPAVSSRPACPLCEGTALLPRPVPLAWAGGECFEPLRGRLGLVECRRCGLAFANPRPSDALLISFYGADGYDCHDCEASAVNAARDREALARLEARTAGRRLLDFGCGSGGLLRLAEQAGWQARGYDLSPAAVETCRRQGLHAAADLTELADGTFDAVVMQHVLEHLPDPAGALAQIRRLLAPDGWLLVEVPNARSLRARLSHPLLVRQARFDERYRAFPLHLWYFGPKSLAGLLAAAGYSLAARWSRGVGLPLRLPGPGQRSPEPPARLLEPGAPGAPGSRRRLLRALARTLLLDRGLGENLVALARPSSPAGQRSTRTSGRLPA